MKIDIRITEILSKVITIDSSSVEEAIVKAKEMYKDEKIVLDSSDFDGNVIIEKKEDNFNSKKDLLINKVINYLIEDEEKHYIESGKPKNHIYLTLLKLQSYL
jgi:hypothetical protein